MPDFFSYSYTCYGDVTYHWTPNVSQQAVADNLAPGTYIVVVRDADGCEWTTTVTIANVPPIDFELATKNFRNGFGACRGRARVNVSTGTPPFIYNWMSPSNCQGQTCEGAAPGTYTVEVIDANGCRETQSVLIECTTTRITNVFPIPFDAVMTISYQLMEDASVGLKPAGLNEDAVEFLGLQPGPYYLNLVIDGVEQPDLYLVIKQ